MQFALVCSLFCFAGYAPESSARIQESVKTELRVQASVRSKRTSLFTITKRQSFPVRDWRDTLVDRLFTFQTSVDTSLRQALKDQITFQLVVEDFDVTPSTHTLDEFSGVFHQG